MSNCLITVLFYIQETPYSFQMLLFKRYACKTLRLALNLLTRTKIKSICLWMDGFFLISTLLISKILTDSTVNLVLANAKINLTWVYLQI